MFKLKNNEEIGKYLEKIIKNKYESCRKFCKEYLNLLNESFDDDDVRKMANRLSQILNGKKSIQTYDLPIFSQLLCVSCEEILSAGETFIPICNRKTNYNIAYSINKQDWIEYINNENCMASYADEFGKTIVDYALEFKNYAFICFLINEGYINLVPDDSDNDLIFTTTTKFKVRPYEHKTFHEELYENKRLRTQIITLALENADYSVLDKMKAKEIPTQNFITTYRSDLNIELEKYYDEHFIEAILNSNREVIKYFCEEYKIKSQNGRNYESTWIFPFIDRLIDEAIKTNSEYINILFDSTLKHNEDVFNQLRNLILESARIAKKKIYSYGSYQDAINYAFRWLHCSKENNVIQFCDYLEGNQFLLTNIVSLKSKTKNLEIQGKINKINDLYFKIINIKDRFFKDKSLSNES